MFNARDIIVIGSSAGGIEALQKLIAGLPADLPATILIAQHTSPTSHSALPSILEQAGKLKASFPQDHEPIRPNHIYVAPPNHHLMVEGRLIRLSQGPKENRTRPAADPLFRSAALDFRSRVVGVVLSGTLDDGTAGLWSVKYQGGVTVVQKPEDALFSGMPRNALRHVEVDYCLTLTEIARLLADLARDPVAESEVKPMTDELEIENRIALGDFAALRDVEKLGELTRFTCPDCHGSIWEIHNGDLVRFRCRTGHAYSAKSLLLEQSEATESLNRSLLRASEENTELRRYLSTYITPENVTPHDRSMEQEQWSPLRGPIA